MSLALFIASSDYFVRLFVVAVDEVFGFFTTAARTLALHQKHAEVESVASVCIVLINQGFIKPIFPWYAVLLPVGVPVGGWTLLSMFIIEIGQSG